MSRQPHVYIVLTGSLSPLVDGGRGIVLAGAYLSARKAEAKKEALASSWTAADSTKEVDAIGYAGLQGYRIQQKDGSSSAVWIDVVAVEDAAAYLIADEEGGEGDGEKGAEEDLPALDYSQGLPTLGIRMNPASVVVPAGFSMRRQGKK